MGYSLYLPYLIISPHIAMNKKEYNKLIHIMVNANAGLVILSMLEEHNLVSEKKSKIFPKGGLSIIKNELSTIYDTTLKLVLDYEKERKGTKRND